MEWFKKRVLLKPPTTDPPPTHPHVPLTHRPTTIYPTTYVKIEDKILNMFGIQINS